MSNARINLNLSRSRDTSQSVESKRLPSIPEHACLENKRELPEIIAKPLLMQSHKLSPLPSAREPVVSEKDRLLFQFPGLFFNVVGAVISHLSGFHTGESHNKKSSDLVRLKFRF